MCKGVIVIVIPAKNDNLIMKEKLKTVFLLSPLILLFDQFTKSVIVNTMPIGSRRVVWENFFDIVHVRNTGAAFGLLAEWPESVREPFFYFISILAIYFLYSFLKQLPDEHRNTSIPIALIFGGALGNITDRIFRGSVVDFLSFHWNNHEVNWNIFGYPIGFAMSWPSFNVADTAITLGVIWLMIRMARHQKEGTI